MASIKRCLIFFFFIHFLIQSGILHAQRCNNADFSYGDFTNWKGYIGDNNLGNFSNITSAIVPGRHSIISSSFHDRYTCDSLLVPPQGIAYCARLGNEEVGAQGERLEYSLTVDSSNTAISASFAVVLSEPYHPNNAQPFFSFKIIDEDNNLLDSICGYYEIFSGLHQGFNFCDENYVPVNWRDWTTIGFDLTQHIGKNIKVVFTTLDCGYGGHFGYCYLFLQCGKLEIDVSYCQGNNDVVLTAPVGFNYLWNTGDTTRSITISNPIIGSVYNCLLTTIKGCNYLLKCTIKYTNVVADFGIFCNDTCSRIKNFIDRTITSSQNQYTVAWDFGDGNSSTQYNPTHYYSSSGFYWVKLVVTTLGGCTDSITKVIHIPEIPTALFSLNDICVNDTAKFYNFSYDAVGIVKWSWDFGDGSPFDTIHWNASHQYLMPGIYAVKLWVQNQGGCTDVLERNINVFGGRLNLSIKTDTVFCYGSEQVFELSGEMPIWAHVDVNFGNGLVNYGNGRGPYGVTWYNSGYETISFHVSDTICNSYFDTTFVILIYDSPRVQAGNDTSICYGYCVQLFGSGGSTYSWTPLDGLSHPNSANTLACPLSTTKYVLVVTENGCSASDEVTVELINTHFSSAISDTAVCLGDTIQLWATGGVSYHWYPSQIVSDSSSCCPYYLASTSNFVVAEVSDSIGCKEIYPINVTVLTSPKVLIGTSADSICESDHLLVFFAGRATNYATFNWSFPGGNVFSGTGRGPYIINYFNSGNYNIKLVVNELNCESDSMILPIKVLPKPVAYAGEDASICLGHSIQLNASGGSSYLWLNPYTLDNPCIPDPVATPSALTIYTVVVFFDNGCSDLDDIVINVFQLPQASISNDTTICKGDTVQLFADGGCYYSWTPTAWLSASDIHNPYAYPSTTYNYWVTIKDSTHCTAIKNVKIDVIEKPLADFIISSNDLCFNDTLIATASLWNSPTANYIWEYNPLFTTIENGNVLQISPDSAGIFEISLLLDDKGCVSEKFYMTYNVHGFKTNLLANSHSLCYNDYNGNVNATVNNTNDFYSYLWSNGDTTSNITGLLPGMYIVTITNSFGCKAIDSIRVLGPTDSLKIDFNFSSSSCNNICDASINAVVTGGTPPYQYLWNFGATSSNLSQLCSGKYTLQVLDNNNCITFDSIILLPSTIVEAAFVANPLVGLAPLNVQFNYTGSSNVNLFWNFGDNTNTLELNPSHTYLHDGIYTVELIVTSNNSDACSDTIRLDIEVKDISEILAPNIFTPNRDGINDFFEITSKYLKNFKIQVYNRWGKLVFESTDANIFWDGNMPNGLPAADGTYFYIISALGKDNVEHLKQGIVVVMR